MAILMILIGLVLSVVIIGLIPLILGCILIYNWYQEVQYNKRSKYLNITMNAGTTLSFVGSDIPFMDRVVSIIRDCANGKYNEQPIIVNMQGSQVSGSIFGPVTKKMGMNIMEIDLHGSVITGSVFDKVIKNGNEIHITVSPSPNSFLDNPDWNQLEKEIQALLKQIHPDGQEARTVKKFAEAYKK